MSADPSPAVAVERRKLPRQRVLKGALMVFGEFTKSFDCRIRNLTAEGARLTLPSTLGVPSAFHLLIPAEQRICPAEEIWRTATELGVHFKGPWAFHAGRG